MQTLFKELKTPPLCCSFFVIVIKANNQTKYRSNMQRMHCDTYTFIAPSHLAGLCVSIRPNTVISTILRAWIITYSSSMLQPLVTSHTAFTPRAPFVPVSIDWYFLKMELRLLLIDLMILYYQKFSSEQNNQELASVNQ